VVRSLEHKSQIKTFGGQKSSDSAIHCITILYYSNVYSTESQSESEALWAGG